MFLGSRLFINPSFDVDASSSPELHSFEITHTKQFYIIYKFLKKL